MSAGARFWCRRGERSRQNVSFYAGDKAVARSYVTPMNRRHFLVATAALAALPLIVFAQAFASLDQIATYLNGLTLADGRFTQHNADGSRSVGSFMLQKPGKIRFEYTAPDKAVVVSDGIMVGIIDPKATDEAQVYELKRTPLSLLLRTDVDLKKPGVVRDLTGNGSETLLTLVDPADPNSGTMLLIFSHTPVFHLSQWTITDESGSETTVEIETMTRGTKHPALMFDIPWARANFGKG